MAKQRKRAEDEDRLMKESFSESKSNRWKQEYKLQLQIKVIRKIYLLTRFMMIENDSFH